MFTGRLACSLGLFAFVLLAVVQNAAAGDRDHEDGFFLRLSLGGGGAGTEIETVPRISFEDGTSGNANFAVGAIVTPNLAVHGTIWGWSVRDPTVKVGSLAAVAPGDLGLTGLGPGLTWYWMPANIYVSTSLGVALAFGLHSIPMDAVPQNWEGADVALRFSATMN